MGCLRSRTTNQARPSTTETVWIPKQRKLSLRSNVKLDVRLGAAGSMRAEEPATWVSPLKSWNHSQPLGALRLLSSSQRAS